MEGELAHDEDRASRLADVQVHLAGFIAENAERRDPCGEVPGHGLVVVRACPQQDEQAAQDGPGLSPADGDPGPAHPLDNCTHVRDQLTRGPPRSGGAGVPVRRLGGGWVSTWGSGAIGPGAAQTP